MAIAPTGDIYKSLSFDNTSSRTYGVYITGEAVYNAPERDVEMITIPGRNGAFALDKGRFQNIEVTYPAGIFAETEADFATAISDFRNFLCSKKGYARLEDEYNPNEYRMAVYKSGLEVTPAQLRAGEFNITFECQPQRWLTSGETAVAVASGGTLTNPTLFEASPLLQVYGYGTVNIDGAEITVDNQVIGPVVLAEAVGYSRRTSIEKTIDTTYAEIGDTITVDGGWYYNYWQFDATTVSDASASASGNGSVSVEHVARGVKFTIYISTTVFNYGTSSSESVVASFTITHSSYGTLTGSCTITLSYDGADNITIQRAETKPAHQASTQPVTYKIQRGSIILDSTHSTLGSPTYIDLDIGEAYMISGGTAVSLNNTVEIPAELPTLPSGATTITFDNTFTKVDIVPRWWKI